MTVPRISEHVNDIVPPQAGEFAAYLLEIGEHEEAYALQQRQVVCGRHAAIHQESFCPAWPVAMQRGYVEALQELPY